MSYTYKFLAPDEFDKASGKTDPFRVIRSDGKQFNINSEHRYSRQYRAWVAAGNTIEEAD